MTLGKWYIKCLYNIKVRILHIGDLTVSLATALIDAFWVQGDPTTYGYILPEVQNVKLEAQEHRLKAKKEASGDYCSDLKAEL